MHRAERQPFFMVVFEVTEEVGCCGTYFFNALPTAFTVGFSFRAILCKACIVILDYEGQVCGRWWNRSTGSSSFGACCCWRTCAGRRHGEVGVVVVVHREKGEEDVLQKEDEPVYIMRAGATSSAQTLIFFARVDGKETEKSGFFLKPEKKERLVKDSSRVKSH